MCKDMNETKKERTETHNEKDFTARRLISLAALTKLEERAKGLKAVRRTFDRAREAHERGGKELAEIAEMIEREEDHIMDEAMGLGVFEDEEAEDAECDCGCDDSPAPSDASPTSSSYEDEEADEPAVERPAEKPLVSDSRKAPGFIPVVLGALGVACAVASFVAQSLADERKG